MTKAKNYYTDAAFFQGKKEGVGEEKTRCQRIVSDVLSKFKDPLRDNGFNLDPKKEWDLLHAVEKELKARMQTK